MHCTEFKAKVQLVLQSLEVAGMRSWTSPQKETNSMGAKSIGSSVAVRWT